MRKKSFVRGIVLFTVVLMVLLVGVLAAYSALSVHNLQNELARSSENFLELYGNELKNRITQADRLLKNIVTQNSANIVLLKSENETTRYHATQSIFNFMSELMQSDHSADMVCLADKAYDITLDAESRDLSYADRTALRDFTRTNTDNPAFTTEWLFITINGKTYLYKMYIYNGRSVAAFLETQTFLNSIPAGDYGSQVFALSDETDAVAAVRGLPAGSWQAGSQVSALERSDTFRLSYAIVANQVVLNSIIKINLWSQLRAGTVAAALMILLPLLLSVFLIRYVQREIIGPMHQMTVGMDRINQGEYELRMAGEYQTREFSLLQQTFNRLMDEIIGLKMKSYLKMIELQETELKCIRLQIRPHFFLNAMSTISSLSSQGKDRQIKSYIEALSKNIRYMFKSGLHTVPLREELRHVENYLEMQDLKYPGCVFHFIEVQEGLDDWRVPQMLIHTFIENEFKYAVSVDSTLTLLIKAGHGELNGDPVLVLDIEDDGQGYPPEVLAYLNDSGERPPTDGSRIGLWSIKRMMELMYERQDLVSFANIEPHGCLNRIIVPAGPLHELQAETIQNTL